MKRNASLAAWLGLGLAATLIPCRPILAQATKPAPAPARPARPGPLISPQLGTDGSVTFRFIAPKATSVKVNGQFGPESVLAKDEGGI